MRLGVLLVFGLACLAGFVVDTITSALGLIAWMNARTAEAVIIMCGFGLIVTSATAGTKYAIKSSTPWILRLLWILCAMVDLYTLLIGLIHFCINGGSLNEPVPITLDEMIKAVTGHPPQAAFAGLMFAIITTATISGPYCLDAINAEKPPV